MARGPGVRAGVVGGVGESGPHVPDEEPGEGARDHDDDKEDIGGGKNAEGAAEVEAWEIDAARFPLLAEQQTGDEEAREDEEDADAQNAIVQERSSREAGSGGRPMRETDDGDSHGAKSIQ